MESIHKLSVDEARRARWKQDAGTEAAPYLSLYASLLDALNYADEIERQGFSQGCQQTVARVRGHVQSCAEHMRGVLTPPFDSDEDSGCSQA